MTIFFFFLTPPSLNFFIMSMPLTVMLNGTEMCVLPLSSPFLPATLLPVQELQVPGNIAQHS